MTLRRLFRILWARRLFVLAPTACTLLGAIVVILTSSPRYEASTRVIMDIVKPDAVTGFQITEKARDAYIGGQISMLRADEVTSRVVETMGWLEDPGIIAAWQAAPDRGDDFRRWAGRRLAVGIGAGVVPETNILVIRFQSSTPDAARLVADNIRTAFIEASVEQARASARGQATNLEAQAERERQRLVELQAFKANLERQTGTMLSDSGTTIEAQQALQAIRVYTPPPAANPSKVRDESQILRSQLENIDSSIVVAGRTLGPNNPIMVEMQRRRQFVAARLAGATPTDPVSDMTMKRLELATALIRQSSDRIHSVSDKTLALRLVQDEIKRRRDLFDKASKKAGEELMVSNVSDANLTPIGATTVDPTPVFPNYALILGGGGALGLMVGALLAFIVEALARRARGVEDVRGAIEAPVLGVLPAISWPKALRPTVERAKRPKKGREPKAARGKTNLVRA